MSKLWHKAAVTRESAALTVRDIREWQPRKGLCNCWECGRKYLPPTITPGFCSLRCQVRGLKSRHVPGAYR